MEKKTLKKSELEKVLSSLFSVEIELTDYDYRNNGFVYNYFASEDFEILNDNGYDVIIKLDIRAEFNESKDLKEIDIYDIKEMWVDGEEINLNTEYYSKIEKYLLKILY